MCRALHIAEKKKTSHDIRFKQGFIITMSDSFLLILVLNFYSFCYVRPSLSVYMMFTCALFSGVTHLCEQLHSVIYVI